MAEENRIAKEVNIVKFLEFRNYRNNKVYSVEINFLNNLGSNRRIEIGMVTIINLNLKVGSKIIIYYDNEKKWINYKIHYEKTYLLYGKKYIPYLLNKRKND